MTSRSTSILEKLMAAKPPSVMRKEHGFTMIEALIVVALIAFLAALGLVAGVDTYQRYLFRADLSTAAALLQKARGSALSNVGETSHGVYFGAPGTFVLYYGGSYVTRNATYDLTVPTSNALQKNGTQDVAFAQLSGDSAGGGVVLSDGVKTATITVNTGGGINW